MDYPTSTDMVVREGSNVTLKCAATGSPIPAITWRRESGETISLPGGNEGKYYCYSLSTINIFFPTCVFTTMNIIKCHNLYVQKME